MLEFSLFSYTEKKIYRLPTQIMNASYAFVTN